MVVKLIDILYDLNEISIVLLILIVFLTIVRYRVLYQILDYLRKNYSSFYSDLAPMDLPIWKVFISGFGTMYISYKLHFSSLFQLDEYVSGKISLFMFISYLRIILIIILLLILTDISIIRL